MKLIIWCNSFETGIPSVDTEHQEMIVKINEALEKIYKNQNSKEIVTFLNDIYHSISDHFTNEEKMMLWSGFKEYHTHKKDHKNLLQKLKNIIADTEKMEIVEFDSHLVDHLIKWFLNHFATFDARLHGYFN